MAVEEQFYQSGSGIYFSQQKIPTFSAEHIEFVSAAAMKESNGRARLCGHADQNEAQHEMLIAVRRGCYIPPHRHLNKSESLTVVKGQAVALIFSDDGNVKSLIDLETPGQSGSFFYRMPAGVFHTLYIKSEMFIFIETTVGPFDPSVSEQAVWAPAEGGIASGITYLADQLKNTNC